MNRVRGRATALGIATVVASGLLAGFSVAGASAAALASEKFEAFGNPTMAACTSGTLTYTVEGVATGPYPGTFTATGSVTNSAEKLTKFTESFTIVSGATTIEGTEALPSNPSNSDFGNCNEFAITDGTYTAKTPDCTETGSFSGQGQLFVVGEAKGEPTQLTHVEAFKSGSCAAAPPPSQPGVCESKLGAITINGNLNAGPGCELDGTKVEGNVTVESKGSLTTNGASIKGNVQSNKEGRIVMSGGSVGGNVQTNGASEIAISGGSIGGNVQIQGTTGISKVVNATVKGNIQIQNSNFEVLVEGDNVGGDMQVQSDTGAGLSSLSGNTIGGNLQVQNNTGAAGSSLVISSNSVTNTLQCQSNTPPPGDAGLENKAKQKQGQCEKL